MRSAKRSLESIGRNFWQRGPMTCDHRTNGLLNQTSRTVLDDSGSLAITAWTCSKCGGVLEEIRILTQDGRAQTRPIRFAVAPPHTKRQTGQFAHHAPIT
jgi:hypothetical protein